MGRRPVSLGLTHEHSRGQSFDALHDRDVVRLEVRIASRVRAEDIVQVTTGGFVTVRLRDVFEHTFAEHAHAVITTQL